MYEVKYDGRDKVWRLSGAGDCSFELTFEQALVSSSRRPGSGSTLRFRAIHGLTLPEEARNRIRPTELRNLGIYPGARQGPPHRLWRLMPDGSIESGV